jgi:hypothetical protein|uniref:Uncharacterized protein n=1 Tax=Picea sitchensis TaxID=3332 RepID=A0A6B9XSE8_PICSI|nr:hypothetical protein Q903MT_gene5674 [Picea sitchensis]
MGVINIFYQGRMIRLILPVRDRGLYSYGSGVMLGKVRALGDFIQITNAWNEYGM